MTSPGRALLRAALLALLSSAAWAQHVEVAPVGAPVSVGAVGVAALAGAATVSPSAALSLPVAVTRPLAFHTASALGVRLSPVSYSALAAAQGSTLGTLQDVAARVEATGSSDRSRKLGELYDRSRGPSAQPLAAAAGSPSGPTGRALLDQVEATAKKGHNAIGYDAARAYMFGKGHHVTRGGKSGVMEVYTQTFVPGTSEHGGDYHGSPKDGDWDREGMNAEHVWPQSFFAKKLPMKSDLHNLMPTFVHPNGLRGHMPFGEVVGKPEYSNRAGAKLGGGVFEPPPAAKGQIARAILYFVARYRDDAVRQGEYTESFFNQRVEMFLRWNREHPPEAEEKATNDLNAQAQGNRNPFVDDYTLADRIGVAGFRFDPARAGRPDHQEYFDFKPYTNRAAIIGTTGMKPYQEQRRQVSPTKRGGPAAPGRAASGEPFRARYDGRRKKN